MFVPNDANPARANDPWDVRNNFPFESDECLARSQASLGLEQNVFVHESGEHWTPERKRFRSAALLIRCCTTVGGDRDRYDSEVGKLEGTLELEVFVAAGISDRFR